MSQNPPFIVITDNTWAARVYLNDELGINPNLPDIQIVRYGLIYQFFGLKASVLFHGKTHTLEYANIIERLVRDNVFTKWTDDDVDYLKGMSTLGLVEPWDRDLIGTIQASQIQAGTITANKIAATSIVSSKLLLINPADGNLPVPNWGAIVSERIQVDVEHRGLLAKCLRNKLQGSLASAIRKGRVLYDLGRKKLLGHGRS